MEEKTVNEPSSGNESHSERDLVEMLANDSECGNVLGFFALPESLRHIVANYVSDDEKDRMRIALLGKPHVTLCLSQHVDLELGFCWYFGCLSPKDQWETSTAVKVDKTYLISDYKACLDFLSREICPFIIKVLVIQLDMSSKDFPSALDDLQAAIEHLGDHLTRVEHVVIAIDKYSFCCFSFQNSLGIATIRRQAVDGPLAMKQILSDLRTCWNINHELDTSLLLDLYILKNAKPKSDIYLSKFVVSITHCRNQNIFLATYLTANMYSNKLRWLYYLETLEEVNNIDNLVAHHCHGFYLDASKHFQYRDPIGLSETVYGFENNHVIERIVVKSHQSGHITKLPRFRVPRTAAMRPSALIELALINLAYVFHVTDLNNGQFPHLAHLSVIKTEMKGHLDSHRVPHLKTLKIELKHCWHRESPSVYSHIHKCAQDIMDASRPWQLVATQWAADGWSLASYDEHTANPQDDGKEDSFPCPPLIRELMLVARVSHGFNEWQLQLEGRPSLEAAAKDHSDRLLLWAPECVEKIALFSTTKGFPNFDLRKKILGQTRALTSLTCHGMKVVIDSDALPNLRALTVIDSLVTLRGVFSHLHTLSFENSELMAPWEVKAPVLTYLNCDRLNHGNKLSLCPQSLPRLSYLRIALYAGSHELCPAILVDEDSVGLSHVKHVVLGYGVQYCHFFDEWQVNKVSHLELILHSKRLLPRWREIEWQCESLTVHVFENDFFLLDPRRLPTTAVLPPLPWVTTLTVTEKDCRVLLDGEMHELTECSVPSPESLGNNLRCPLLECIHYTGQLSESDKEKCLDRATYEAMGAEPTLIYFDNEGEVKMMLWDDAPSAANESSSAGPLEASVESAVLHKSSFSSSSVANRLAHCVIS